MRRVLTAVASLALLALVPAAARTATPPSPSPQVGAVYFDGWACPLTNDHFSGLLDGPYSGRQPLFGWRDNTRESMRTQLSWAHQDGIGFFLFDWYRENIDPCVNVAHDNYVALGNHQGVGFALMYVNHDPFGVSPEEWPSFAEQWVTRDFLNPDYVRVDGKPLLVIFNTTLFRQQQGGTAGVNAALTTLRETAIRHGLPGVFIVGGRYTGYLNVACFPQCDATDGGPGGLPLEHYDALTDQGASAGILAPVDGARPYGDLVSAEEANWDRFAEMSPVPYIPSVTVGWDPRPWGEQVDGRLFWLTRRPDEVGRFLKDAIAWTGANPAMRAGAPPSPPMVLLQAWNELGEGQYVVPTRSDGYAYGRALASAVGKAWDTLHTRRLSLARNGRALTGALTVDDQWSPCEIAALLLQRRSRTGWRTVRQSSTKPGGSFSVLLPTRAGRYRLSVPASTRYGQRCSTVESTVATMR